MFMCGQSEWTNRYEMVKLGEKEIMSLFSATQLDFSMLEKDLIYITIRYIFASFLRD